MVSIPVNHEVAEALSRGDPIVALESAVITHGLPREALPASTRLKLPEWDRSAPVNLEVARAMQRIVRNAGAVPATVGIIAGQLRVGMNESELVMLAQDRDAEKASSANLAAIMAMGRNAGATVSATLAACALTHQEALAQSKGFYGRAIVQALPGIRVFATGGIGGIHRGWQHHLDISADLRALGSTKTCVVCSGIKSILDLPATLEALQTLGVPVVGYRTSHMPRFQCAGSNAHPVPHRSDSLEEITRICMAHWSAMRFDTSIVLANPVPAEFAMNESELEPAIQQAEQLATAQNITGPARTPFLLAQIDRLTNHRSLEANLALLMSNAQVAAEFAIALCASTTSRAR